MKKIIICLSVWAGLVACNREEAALPEDDVCPITFFGRVQEATPETRALAGAAEDPQDEVITGRYGTIHVRRTAEARYESDAYKDMDDDAEYSVNVTGALQCVKDSAWYWNDGTHHLFHAWTLPKDGADGKTGNDLVSVNENGRFGRVDLSMNGRYKSPDDTTYICSNLEYFIGAVKGPVMESTNPEGLVVTLPFKHLVAKIIVVKIMYIHHDGASENLENAEISFYMPNMPAKAYWKTGVPASVPDWTTYEADGPKVMLSPEDSGYPLLAPEDFGVSGTLSPGDAFYIYPCRFADGNGVTSGKFGDIQFRYGNSWFYGSLETITAVQGLEAGQCLGVMLQLKDGTVKGIYPHITDWSDDQSDLPVHDRPGIYNENEWKMFVDWLRSRKEHSDLEPPAGIFDENGNLNLYGNLDLTGQGTDIEELLKNYFSGETGKKLYGHGHRIKTDKQWGDDLNDYLDNLWVTAEGTNKQFK